MNKPKPTRYDPSRIIDFRAKIPQALVNRIKSHQFKYNMEDKNEALTDILQKFFAEQDSKAIPAGKDEL